MVNINKLTLVTPHPAGQKSISKISWKEVGR
nr:MAG TPA: hypothetical protein [Caudoviricetes sp.]